jgi:hypothetical protein
MALTVSDQPIAGDKLILTTKITHSNDDTPVRTLQTLHERRVHNFITKLDFSHFSHIHHEDFKSLTTKDIDSATLSFPYTFPTPGAYRMVSEFTDSTRTWTKHFDIQVGSDYQKDTTPLPYSYTSAVGDFSGYLNISDGTIIAGSPTEMLLKITENNLPVKNLKLWLGSEAHVAIWRRDGKYFGHTHSYTPAMRNMMQSLADKAHGDHQSPNGMKAMMAKMMAQASELIFEGPTIPIFFIFPQPGQYVAYIECAPGGRPIVFRFVLKVVAASQDTTGHKQTTDSLLGNTM